MKKKLLAVMMSAMMVASLAACGSSDESTTDESTTETTQSTEAETYTIGICQYVEHDALDLATEGFEDALTELLGEGNVTFDLQNAQNEQAMVSTIINNFVSADVDLIMANATPPLTAAATATADIPIVGTSVTDYATALQIDDWTGSTGINVTGTTDLAPIEEQEDMLVELFPDVEKVGILYCSAEPNSTYQAEKFAEALEEDGIAYEKFTASDSNELQAVATSAASSSDVIYVPTDNLAASNTEIINNVCLPAGVPVIAGEAGTCSGCGVATLSISYYDIGYRAGEMAYEILVNGADITTMKVEGAPNVTKLYNAAICEELGITPPEGYEAIE